jgi:hypothetical protein
MTQVNFDGYEKKSKYEFYHMRFIINKSGLLIIDWMIKYTGGFFFMRFRGCFIYILYFVQYRSNNQEAIIIIIIEKQRIVFFYISTTVI